VASVRHGDQATQPIVVGGCHRSGTSLLRRILDAHPRIHCGPEVKFFLDFYGGFIEDPVGHLRFIKSARSILPEDELLETLGAAFLEIHERAARAVGKPRWADKAPENMIFLDAWSKLLGENWVLLHVVRNPLDTLASMREAPFPRTVPSDLEGRIDHYLRYTEAGLDFARVNPDRYVRVVYEALVSEPESRIRSLMAELGEQFDPAQLAFNEAPHQPGLEDPKVAQTTYVHLESVGRWRGRLPTAQARRIVERTKDLWEAVDEGGRWPLAAGYAKL